MSANAATFVPSAVIATPFVLARRLDNPVKSDQLVARPTKLSASFETFVPGMLTPTVKVVVKQEAKTNIIGIVAAAASTEQSKRGKRPNAQEKKQLRKEREAKEKEEWKDDISPEEAEKIADEAELFVSPSASAGLEIVKVKPDKSKSDEKKAPRKFLRIQQKIASKHENLESAFKKKKRESARRIDQAESAKDRKEQQSVTNALAELTDSIGSIALGTSTGSDKAFARPTSQVDAATIAAVAVARPIKKKQVNIKGMVDGMTPMEIERERRKKEDPMSAFF